MKNAREGKGREGMGREGKGGTVTNICVLLLGPNIEELRGI